MYDHGITATIARQRHAELMAEARSARLAREARNARHAGAAPRAGRRGWPRLIPNPARAR